MRPRIGITSFVERKPRADYLSVSMHYVKSVAGAGGLPLVLPIGFPDEAKTCAEGLDGLLIAGGKDIDPAVYGEEPAMGLKTFDPAQDEWELALFAAARSRGLPVFGICRGFQLIDVALGGSLYQDLHSQLPESQLHNPEDFPVDRLFHGISIEGGSVLESVFGARSARVNSFHHQAVKALGAGLRVTATAADGVIEAFESNDPGEFVHGVQFHPEGLAAAYPVFLGLFAAFVEASRRRAARGG